MKSSLKHKLYIPVGSAPSQNIRVLSQAYNKQLETQEKQFKWKKKNEFTPFSWKTEDVSGRTKFGECILLPCGMSASLIRHSALCSLRGPANLVLSVQREMGKNKAGLMAQVLTRIWPLANENLKTVPRTGTPFSGS